MNYRKMAYNNEKIDGEIASMMKNPAEHSTFIFVGT